MQEPHCFSCGSFREDNNLYAWGRNVDGQLGLGHYTDKEIPTLVKEMMGVKIVDIKCASHHSFVITKSGNVYAWGKNNVSQLGFISKSQSINIPTLVKELKGGRY